MEKELYVLSDKEVKRAFVMEHVVNGSMTVREAAQALSLSERQVKRLKAGVKRSGVAFLAHRNRGRKPRHAIPDDLRRRVVDLATTTYRGANYSHLSELLAEYENIQLSVSSVTRILRSAGIKSPHKHRPPKLHRSRPRKPQFGQLVQLDASPFPWLEDRGPILCLHGAIDDATGMVLGATFRFHEDLQGYFEVAYQMISSYGIPLAVYSDRHSIFIAPNVKLTLEEELAGRKFPLTQFGRALEELKITHIPAYTPQAKGRIERLWQTFQDRLVIELRLANASTIEEANAVLGQLVQRHNARFAVRPLDTASAFRPAPKLDLLRQILCRQEQRSVSNGSTFSYLGHTYQLVDHTGVVLLKPGAKVTLHLHSDASLNVSYLGKLYNAQELPQPLPATSPAPAKPPSPNERAGLPSHRKPAPDHPWRRSAVFPRRKPVPSSNSIIPLITHQEVTFSQHTLG